MIELHNLKNTTLKRVQAKRRGRGPGSGNGKTSGRGEKGAGSRSGWKSRMGYEGGQLRLYCKLPHKGFTRGRFFKLNIIINLNDIQKFFNEGETVNLATLHEKGMVPKNIEGGLKVLGNGELSKKVNIEAMAFSESAKAKLDMKKINYKVI